MYTSRTSQGAVGFPFGFDEVAIFVFPEGLGTQWLVYPVVCICSSSLVTVSGHYMHEGRDMVLPKEYACERKYLKRGWLTREQTLC